MSALRDIEIAGADRIVYPVAHFTRRDVVDYYAAIAPVMVPHLKDHPVTLKRYPDEAGGESFWEKDAPAFTPKWVKRAPVWRRSGESQICYVVVNDARTLVWAASVGTLEFHPFLAHAANIERPTAIVFDLDPGEGAFILQCARVALLLRDLLERLGLKSFVKVSGSKGLQVYVPLNTAVSYAITQPFAKTVAELLAREHPRQIVAEMQRSERSGRVFIDWSQNADYKSTIAVYSLRAKRRDPYVSAPVTWVELRDALDSHKPASSLFFSPERALQRVRELGDLFAPVLKLKQKLPETFVEQLAVAGVREVEDEPTAPHRLRKTSPRASVQGGKRRFAIEKTGTNGLALTIEVGDKLRTWMLGSGLPKTGTTEATERASRAIPANWLGNGSRAALWDRGTYEIIDGSFERRDVELYFAGEKIDDAFRFRAEEPGRWYARRVRIAA